VDHPPANEINVLSPKVSCDFSCVLPPGTSDISALCPDWIFLLSRMYSVHSHRMVLAPPVVFAYLKGTFVLSNVEWLHAFVSVFFFSVAMALESSKRTEKAAIFFFHCGALWILALRGKNTANVPWDSLLIINLELSISSRVRVTSTP